jgi:hypothetical protein
VLSDGRLLEGFFRLPHASAVEIGSLATHPMTTEFLSPCKDNPRMTCMEDGFVYSSNGQARNGLERCLLTHLMSFQF